MHNKKPVQRILSLCLAIAIVLGIAIGTIVQAFAAPTKDMMVTDNAGTLTAEQESEIEDMLYAINQRTGVELAVYTIETLNGQDIETKANDLFRELGLGDSEKNNGLLLLIALNDRKFRLEVGYGLEGTIPDTKAAEIINTMTPYFKEGNYADGIKAAVSKTENVLNGEADTTTEKKSECLETWVPLSTHIGILFTSKENANITNRLIDYTHATEILNKRMFLTPSINYSQKVTLIASDKQVLINVHEQNS